MYTANKYLRDPNNHVIMSFLKQNIKGNPDKPETYREPRIVRIDSLGHEKNFVWTINGCRYSPKPGDFILFSGIDLRIPIVRHSPSDVMISTLILSPGVFIDDSGLLGLFYTKDPARRLIRAGTLPCVEREFGLLEDELMRPDCNPTAAACRAKLLLIELCRGLEFSPGQDRNGSHIAEITAFIGKHLATRLTIDNVSKALGISPSLLSKELNLRLGVSFPDYIRRLRVNNVISLLSSRNINVMDAAFESGFSSMQGFYKTFREITGTSPREMLKSGVISSEE